MNKFGKYFYGNEISNYGQENGFVDYATFAKAFDAVLNNDIMSKTWGTCGEWEQESGFVDNSEEIEELREELEEIGEIRYTTKGVYYVGANGEEIENAEVISRIEKLEERIEELEAEQDEQPEVYQWYIISDNGARICEEFNEIVFYNSELDMYLWGVTHWGTSWDYVLTDIPCEKKNA